MTSPTAIAKQMCALPRPSWLGERAWSFDTIGVETNDDILAVSEAGRGPVLFFVHVGTWSFIWRDLMKLLAENFRCVTLDAPGNGRTQSKTNAPVTMRRASAAIRAVIDALDLRDFTLILHDLGGPCGLLALADEPQRINGIVAMNTFAWNPDHPGLRKMLSLMGSPWMREFDVITELIPRITGTAFGIGRQLSESDRRVFRAGMDARGIRSFHHYLRDALRCEDVYGSIAQAFQELRPNSPVLTIFGERNDPFGFQKRWTGIFPQAQRLVVRNGNHFPMCDAPELCAQAIRQWHAKSVDT